MRRSMMAVSLVVALGSGAALAQSPFRQAGGLLDRGEHKRDMMVSAFVGLPWYFGYGGFPLGVSGRFYLPLMHDGFIPPVNDSFGLEFGADFLAVFASFGTLVEIGIPAEVLWTFYLTPSSPRTPRWGRCWSSGLETGAAAWRATWPSTR